jgi:succinoglycan biosynthesis transport protein ExoP
VAVPDAVLLGSAVDGVIMVLRAGVTPREVAMRGLELQLEENSNVLGLIVNDLARVLPYYYDYKYYHYDRTESSESGEQKDE